MGVLVWQEVGIPWETCTEVGKKEGVGVGTYLPQAVSWVLLSVCVCDCFLGRGACCSFR